MQHSFVKTLQGQEIEFIRLMYPVRYNVFLRILNANPFKLTCKKSDEGTWEIDEPKELPGWVNELTLSIQNVIEENEAAVYA